MPPERVPLSLVSVCPRIPTQKLECTSVFVKGLTRALKYSFLQQNDTIDRFGTSPKDYSLMPFSNPRQDIALSLRSIRMDNNTGHDSFKRRKYESQMENSSRQHLQSSLISEAHLESEKRPWPDTPQNVFISNPDL